MNIGSPKGIPMTLIIGMDTNTIKTGKLCFVTRKLPLYKMF